MLCGTIYSYCCDCVYYVHAITHFAASLAESMCCISRALSCPR